MPTLRLPAGAWNGVSLGLQGGEGENFNHAKIGISKDRARPLCIFGDVNQQGGLGPGVRIRQSIKLMF